MKITFEIPNTSVALVITGIYEHPLGYKMATRTVETSECKDGAEIVCEWGVNEE